MTYQHMHIIVKTNNHFHFHFHFPKTNPQTQNTLLLHYTPDCTTTTSDHTQKKPTHHS